MVRVGTSSCSFYSSKKKKLDYGTRKHTFKRLVTHFQISATRSGWKISETAVALPHSRECTKEPISALPNNGSKKKLGAKEQLRNILQEKLRGRGGSSCRFDRTFGKKNFFFVGNSTQVSVTQNYFGKKKIQYPYRSTPQLCSKP